MSKFQIILFGFLVFLTLRISAQETYNKSYFDNGKIKSEGWLQNNQKIKYWKFYFDNGNIQKQGHYYENKPVGYWYFYRKNNSVKSEGHFDDGKKNNWWIFYNHLGEIVYKCQFKNNKKNGYSLVYTNKKLVKSEKFIKGKKIKEWKSYAAFTKDNNLSDLK